jgi:hypothetical protein
VSVVFSASVSRCPLAHWIFFFFEKIVLAMAWLPFDSRTALKFSAHCGALATCCIGNSASAALESALLAFSPTAESETLSRDFHSCIPIALTAALGLAKDAVIPDQVQVPEDLAENRGESLDETAKRLSRHTVQAATRWARAVNCVPDKKRPLKKDFVSALAEFLHSSPEPFEDDHVKQLLSAGLEQLDSRQRFRVLLMMIDDLRDKFDPAKGAGVGVHATLLQLLERELGTMDDERKPVFQAVFDCERCVSPLFFSADSSPAGLHVIEKLQHTAELLEDQREVEADHFLRVRSHVLCILAMHRLELEHDKSFDQLLDHTDKLSRVWSACDDACCRKLATAQYVAELLHCASWSSEFEPELHRVREIRDRFLELVDNNASGSDAAAIRACAQYRLGGAEVPLPISDNEAGSVAREAMFLYQEQNYLHSRSSRDTEAMSRVYNDSLAQAKAARDWVEEVEWLTLASRCALYVEGADTPGVLLALIHARTALRRSSHRRVAEVAQVHAPRMLRALRAQLACLSVSGVCYLLAGMDALGEVRELS